MSTSDKATKKWGFDVRTIDPRVRPQDDFYRYANGRWLKNHKIPPAESRWGTFIMLRYDTDSKLRTIVSDLLAAEHPKGTIERTVADIYRSAADLAAREKKGTKPIEPLQKLIASISTIEELLAAIPLLHKTGIGCFFGTAVDQDAKQSQNYILHVYQGGLGMPERDYYLENTPEARRVREAYMLHIEKLCRLFGLQRSGAKRMRKIVMSVETRLARASMNKVERRDPDKTYHKKSMAELEAEFPLLRLKRYFRKFGAGNQRAVILMQPTFMREVNDLLADTPLPELRAYMEWHLFNETAGLLSRKFVRENFHFYATVLTGVKKMRPLWRRALGAVNGTVPEALGRLYVEKHFTKRAKKMMDGLVSDLFTAYEVRLKKLDWMSAGTKKKAFEKLIMMTRKIGYPARFKSYAGLVVRRDDFAGNMLRSQELEHRREMRKLKKPVDRNEWFMSPQTVNAYFNPGMNEIVFPAAILQPPFFDPEADMGVNYGAIGYTIGHEITHSFDDQGSKFDGMGNLKSWWTLKDRKRFDKKAALVARQFDAYEIAPGMHVNGKLTLGENIADLGGISIAFDAYQAHLARHGRANKAGFTPEQRFFLGCAQGERELTRSEFLKMIVLTDPHSPSEFRVNGPLSNLPEFYEAFGVRRGDKLYRPPKSRAKIW
ncbi:MAG: M13 family metallopeptidase [Patescibacteria group bacterium]|nr:M13 family metallopeptidase [Patescibacteria group bacterium]